MGNVHMEARQINYRGGDKPMSVEEALKSTAGEAAAIAQLQTDVGNLQTIKANQLTIAPTFSAEDEYSVGNIVYYNGLTYRCVNAHTGEWEADDFIPTTIALELESGAGSVIDYSTEEQNTGVKWIDGKDIYVKVITKDSDIGTSNQIAHNISNLGEVIKAFGMMYLPSSNCHIPLSYVAISNNALIDGYCGSLSDITTITVSVNLGTSMRDLVSKIRIILYYTKSTT